MTEETWMSDCRRLTDAELVETLALAHALLRQGWCQGSLAMQGDGLGFADVYGNNAEYYCLVGALAAAAYQVRPEFSNVYQAGLPEQINAILRRQLPAGVMPTTYNDARVRTVADVLAVLERAAAEIGK